MLVRNETPIRLDPGLLTLLLVDVGCPWPTSPLLLPLPVATRAGGFRGVSCCSCSDLEECSDPEDSDRSVASMGLVVRAPTLGANDTGVPDAEAGPAAGPAAAAAATPAAVPAAAAPAATPAADAEELGPTTEPGADESGDSGSAWTATAPSGLEETWLPSPTLVGVPAFVEDEGSPAQHTQQCTGEGDVDV